MTYDIPNVRICAVKECFLFKLRLITHQKVKIIKLNCNFEIMEASNLGILKRILTVTVTAVLTCVITLLVNAAWNEYAIIGYQLSGPSDFYSYESNSLKINLNLENSGNIGVVPISKIYVTNATIIGVNVTGVPSYQLPKFCHFTENMVIVSNLTIPKGWPLSTWMSIYLIPNRNVVSFAIFADISIPADLSHPRNTVIKILPTELIYDRKEIDLYILRK
jgi:hypothetical protein